MVSRLTQSKEAMAQQAREAEEDLRADFVGFREIYKMLVASKKPMVGHGFHVSDVEHGGSDPGGYSSVQGAPP